jgi:mono/diheme cytochrome c family protein
MRVRLKNVVLTLGALAAGGVLVGIVVLYAGFYNVAATHQHLAPTYWLLQIGLRESIERQARRVDVPPLDDAALLERGRALYAANCVQCHGAPGIAPQPFALGLTPLPKNLAPIAGERNAAELYWVIRNGIKMTGMPAWAFRLPERDLWAVTAYVRTLPLISPRDYAAREAAAETREHAAAEAPDAPYGPGDPARGKVAIRQYACTTCHLVPGIVGPHAPVGPPLERIGTREYIAGMLPNTHGNMLRWLKNPQALNPRTAMPDLGVTDRDARDMAAYLYTLR